MFDKTAGEPFWTHAVRPAGAQHREVLSQSFRARQIKKPADKWVFLFGLFWQSWFGPHVRQNGRRAVLDARSAPRRGSAQGSAESILPGAPNKKAQILLYIKV